MQSVLMLTALHHMLYRNSDWVFAALGRLYAFVQY